MESTERIYAADLAKILRKSPVTARRMLADLEEEHGVIVVHRDGRERYTTWDALEQVTELRRPKPAEPVDQTKLISAMRRLLANDSGQAARIEDVEERLERIEIFVKKMSVHPAFKLAFPS
jgi:hypothetical protein